MTSVFLLLAKLGRKNWADELRTTFEETSGRHRPKRISIDLTPSVKMMMMMMMIRSCSSAVPFENSAQSRMLVD
jgi:hypothetical protein